MFWAPRPLPIAHLARSPKICEARRRGGVPHSVRWPWSVRHLAESATLCGSPLRRLPLQTSRYPAPVWWGPELQSPGIQESRSQAWTSPCPPGSREISPVPGGMPAIWAGTARLSAVAILGARQRLGDVDRFVAIWMQGGLNCTRGFAQVASYVCCSR